MYRRVLEVSAQIELHPVWVNLRATIMQCEFPHGTVTIARLMSELCGHDAHAVYIIPTAQAYALSCRTELRPGVTAHGVSLAAEPDPIGIGPHRVNSDPGYPKSARRSGATAQTYMPYEPAHAFQLRLCELTARLLDVFEWGTRRTHAAASAAT